MVKLPSVDCGWHDPSNFHPRWWIVRAMASRLWHGEASRDSRGANGQQNAGKMITSYENDILMILNEWNMNEVI